MKIREKKVIVWSDDDPAMRKLAQLLLEPEGYDVHCAATTAETIDLVRWLLPDVAITDWVKAEWAPQQWTAHC